MRAALAPVAPLATALAASLAASLAACGGDVDLTGVYRVESAVSSRPCGDDQPIADPPAYLKFERGEAFGSTFYSYVACTDAAATECAATGGLLEGFFEPRDDGWLGYSSYASGPDADCELQIQEKTATLDGGRLVVEEHIYREGHLALPPGGCTPGEAEARDDAMPCVAHDRITAARL
jgi:hypothetical protein